MALAGFEKLNNLIKQANSVKKSPSIKKGGLLNRIKQAEDLAYEKLGKYANKYKTLCSKEELEHYLFDFEEYKNGKESYIALDTETDGVVFYVNKVIGFSLTRPDEESVYVPVNHIDPTTNERLVNQITPEQVKEVFDRFLKERPNVKFDYSNSEFDIRMILYTFNINLVDSFGWDDMIVEHLIDENGSHALKLMDKKYYPEDYKNVKEGDIEVVEFRDLFGDVPFAMVNPKAATLYAAGDTHKTLRVKRAQIKWLSEPGREKLKTLVFKTEMRAVPATIRMELRGMKMDIKALDNIEREYSGYLTKYSDMCYKELNKFKDKIDAYRNKMGKKCKIDDPISISSSTQIRILLYDILQVKIEKARNSDKDSSDIKALLKIARRYPDYRVFLESLVKYRNAMKMKATNIDAFREKLGPDGRIHSTFKLNGTVTGRYSSKEPNLQNIPHLPKFRNLFIEDEGYGIGGGDFSKQEVFITVQECKDPKLIEVFHKGLDIYAVLASTITGFDYRDCLEFEVEDDLKTKKKDINGNLIENPEGAKRRALGKVGWLGISYGLGAQGLADKANEDKNKENDAKIDRGEELTEEDKKQWTAEDAQKILDSIHKGYPTASKWIEMIHNNTKKYGYTENMYGRRRNLPEINMNPYSVRLIKNFATDEYVCPTCLEEDPLDFETDYDLKKFTIEDVPKSVYEPYLSMLKETKSAYKRKEIIDFVKKKEKLDIYSNNSKIAQAERQSVNSTIQGGAGCLIKQVMINIDADPILKKYNCGLICTIHDEILLAVPLEHKDECMSRAQYVMIQTAQQFVDTVAVKVDPVLCECWYGEKKGVNREISYKYVDTSATPLAYNFKAEYPKN